jgi:hypothetical protein
VTANDNLVVTVTLTRNDYAKALSALASPKAGLAKRVLFWISVAFLSYMLFSVISISDNWPYRVAFILIVVGILVALTKYVLPYWAARHEIGSEGTSYHNIHGEGKLAWTAFYQIRETADFFLLYTQSNFAQIVPKRCCGSPAEITLYREIVHKYYKGKTDLLR